MSAPPPSPIYGDGFQKLSEKDFDAFLDETNLEEQFKAAAAFGRTRAVPLSHRV